MAEREQQHTHTLIDYEARSKSRAIYTGQACGVGLAVLGTIGGVFLIYHDKTGPGLSVFFSTLVTIVTAFIVSRKTPPAAAPTAPAPTPQAPTPPGKG